MSAKKTSAEERKERLAKALKANIARRKEAARPVVSPAEPPETAQDDEGCPN